MKTVSTKINAQLNAFKALNDEIKTLEKAKEKIKTDIKTLMENKETKVIVSSDYVATLTSQIRKSLDKKLVQELIGEKINTCMKVTSYDVFKVVGA